MTENTAKTADLRVVVVCAIADIGKSAWDSCLAATAGPHPSNPFVTFDFLQALEASACIGAPTGWLPQHLWLQNGSGRTLGVMPAYLKSHSMGEYVFDQGWAQAFESAGGDYYPKVQCSVPFTPVTGPRILIAPGVDRGFAIQAMAGAIKELTARLGASSAHVAFVEEGQMAGLRAVGFLPRTDRQFHWHNAGYTDFDAFLAQLNARKRKAIRKERARSLAGGIKIELLTGAQIKPHHWDVFYRFYLDTGERKWGEPYLNRQFFESLGAAMSAHVLLVMAKQNDTYIAGALNLIGADTLFGRYWGCLETHEFLHFEVCYYQAMDYAIAHGLKTVEAGAQGEHKLARGYMPVTTYSAHHIRHPGLARAIADYLEEERQHVELERAILSGHGPFRKSPSNWKKQSTT
ncbi:FIG110192: hypothetical protein [hydrothermal vent metagenome]|uniref:COGs COG3146 n=1 Tax=hydrothermal vent metagenome TaxID=652676 RepID=A0A3B0UB01_9ZZZZ